MPVSFKGPTDRVQLAWTIQRFSHPAFSVEGHALTFTVRTLPNGAASSVPFTRGDLRYSGTNPNAAWEAVRRVAPLAPLPKRLERHLAPATLLRKCATCGLPFHPGEGRPVLRPGTRGPRWVHGSCIAKLTE